MAEPVVTTRPTVRRGSWLPFAGLLVLSWGVWGAFSSYPTSRYGYPESMVYLIWSLTMLVPAAVALRTEGLDRRGVAARYGFSIGLTGAAAQLLLFRTLTMGPAYIIFPILALSPAVTVLMAMVLLRERLRPVAATGVVMAIVAAVLFSVTGGDGHATGGWWVLFALVVCTVWGAQAYWMRKAATFGVNDASTFAYMTLSGLILIPVALATTGGFSTHHPWQAPAVTALTQVLNAAGALFLVMAMGRGKASVVAPLTNALAPVLTVVLSLIVHHTLPSGWATLGIVLALTGSTLALYDDERRGETAAP